MATNIYNDMLGAVPSGPFYDASGTILPYQDTPSQFSLNTNNPNTTYQIYLNQRPAGTVLTDATGIATVQIQLDLGENTLTISNQAVKSSLTSYITTRNWATWLASIADVLGPIDDQAAQLKLDRDLATVGLDRVDAIWGRRLRTINKLNYPIDTYREMLQIVQQAYRRYGGTTAGLMRVVGAFTHINPLVLPRRIGPTWNLGNQLVANPTLDQYTRLTNISTPFTGIQTNGATVQYNKELSHLYGQLGASILAWDSASKVFTWTAPNGAVGTGAPSSLTDSTATCNIVAGTPAPGRAYSLVGPFDTTTFTNLSLELDGLGIITVVLTSGAATTAASIVTSINTALAGSTRYGSLYNAAAVVANGRIQITALSGSVRLHASDTSDAAWTIFGIPWARSLTTGGPTTPTNVGTFALPIASIAGFPTPDLANTYKIVLGTAPRRTYEAVFINVTSSTITLNANGDINPIANGTPIYVLGQLPYEWAPSVAAQPTLALTITNPALLANATDSFSFIGSSVPDSWWIDVGTSAATAATTQRTGWMHDNCLKISNGAIGSWSLYTNLKKPVMDYIGFPIDAGVWVARDPLDTNAGAVNVSVRLSFDGGTTWTTSAAAALAASTSYKPQYVSISTLIPATATSVRFGILTDAATPAGAQVRIEKVTSRIGAHTGRQLGINTIPRNAHRSKRGYVCLMWSPQAFTADERALLGMPEHSVGHIDTISSAHSVIDRFDVNEVGANSILNVAGYTDAVGLQAGTATNMQMVVRAPARFTYMQPTVTSAVVGEVLIAPVGVPYNFILSKATAQDVSKITLYENGVPVTRDQLSFVDATTLQLNRPPLSSAVYTIDYEILVRYETQPISVGPTPTDRTWYADVFHTLGLDFTPKSVPVIYGVQFDSNFIATLPERSNQDQSTAQIVADDGKTQTILSTDDWRFIGAQSVQINPAVFSSNQLYTISYTARSSRPIPKPLATLEYRQGADTASCAAATYQPLTINQVVAPSAFFQIRATYSNVLNVNDVRLYSLVMKGLNLNGVGGVVPILRDRTWTAGIVNVTRISSITKLDSTILSWSPRYADIVFRAPVLPTDSHPAFTHYNLTTGLPQRVANTTKLDYLVRGWQPDYPDMAYKAAMPIALRPTVAPAIFWGAINPINWKPLLPDLPPRGLVANPARLDMGSMVFWSAINPISWRPLLPTTPFIKVGMAAHLQMSFTTGKLF